MPGKRSETEALRAPLERLPDPLPIPTRARRPSPRVDITPPGSKSLTNRAVLLAALADGTSRLRGALLDAEDADVMVEALTTLGARIERDDADLVIAGVGGRWRPASAPVELQLANSGTSVRFLAGAAMLSPVPVTIDGSARMRERPVAQLADILVQLGATVDHHGEPGYPPLTITPPRSLPRCVKIDLPELESSQYLTALLLIAPLLPGGVTLTSHHPVTSASYVRLTLGLLDTLGASVRMSEDLGVIRVSPAADARTSPTMPAFELDIEPDASGATYFWGAGALGAHCAVSGIPRSSLQPDARLPDLLVRMGCRIERAGDTTTGVRPGPELLPIMADLSDMPDAAMTLAALAAFASGRSMLSGLETLRVKETDRIAAIGAELAKIGVKVETPVLGDKGAVAIEPPTGGIDCAKTASRVEFDTYNDHRMAMAMSLIGIRRPNTFIRNPACVAKTYPQYWRDLADTLD